MDALGSRSELYGTANRDYLTEEVVADAFGRLVNSGSLDSLVRDDRTVVQKILDAVRDMLNAIRRAVSGKGASLTEAQRSEFRDLEAGISGMERRLLAALERSADLQGKTGNDTMTERYSVKGRYWRPDLTRPEWELLNRRMEQEIGDPAHALDEAAQWVYAEEKGVRVFAVYGVGDGTEATPLYASGGRTAAADYQALMEHREEFYHGIDRSRETIGSSLKALRRKQGQSNGGVPAAEGRGADSGYGRVPSLQREGDGRGSSGAGEEDSGSVKLRFSLKSTDSQGPDIRFSRSNREQLEDYAALQRENELLRERVDYWKGQTRRTVSGAVDRKQVDRAARELIDAYGSELEADGIAGDLYALHAKPATRYKGADKTFADTYATTVGQDPR